MFTTAKNLGRRLFNYVGLEVRRKQPAPTPRASMTGALQQLSRLGFSPHTVIDVGVANQTNELYEQFPAASLLLIEPLVEFELSLRDICRRYKAQYILAAAGEKPGAAVLNVHPDKVGSSFLKEVEGAAIDGSPRTVPVVTIDQICSEKNLKGPYLIKVDVQGAELQVLAGAQRTLQQTEAIILEVLLFGSMIGGPQFFDVVSRLKEFGFVAYDICGFLYRPFDNALSQVDIVFVREQGRFRQTHVYATSDQRQVQLREIQSHLAEVSKKLS